MKPDVIQTHTCLVSLDKFGIIHKTVRPHSHLDVADIEESDEIGFRLAKKKKALVLYDARPSFTLTAKAMEFLHKHLLSKRRIASAIVSDKPGIKLLGEYFKNLKPGSPQIKVFHGMREATAWLLTFTGEKSTSPANIVIKKVPVAIRTKTTKPVIQETVRKDALKGSLVTGIAKVEVDKNNIVYKRVLNDTHIDLKALKKSFGETVAFLGTEKRLMVYDLRPHFTITDDALDFVVDEIMGGHGIATAVLAHSIGVYIMADYAVKIKKIRSPLKVFTDEDKALKWLESQKN